MHKCGSCTMCINCAHMHIGLFLDFGGSDRLDIAYDDSTKCFSAFYIIARSWRIIQMSPRCIFEWSKEPKKVFGRFLEFGLLGRLDILHIMIILNVFQHLTRLPGHGGSFKNHKNTVLNDPKCKKEVFSHFLTFGLLGRLDILWCDTVSNIWKLY